VPSINAQQLVRGAPTFFFFGQKKKVTHLTISRMLIIKKFNLFGELNLQSVEDFLPS